MAEITFKGNSVNTRGSLPSVGEQAKNFTLVGTDLSEKSLSDYKGKKVILTDVPRLKPAVCATSVRKLDEEASSLDNPVVLCLSKDLAFAQSEYGAAKGLPNVEMLSDFR